MHLTKRQEAYWEKKMLELEKRLIAHYRTDGESESDGSFCMSAFKEGYWLGVRIGKRARGPARV